MAGKTAGALEWVETMTPNYTGKSYIEGTEPVSSGKKLTVLTDNDKIWALKEKIEIMENLYLSLRP